MKIIFRPFDYSDEDYRYIVDLRNELFPNQPASVEEYRHSDNVSEKKYLRERYVGEQEGAPVCSILLMEPFWSLEPGKYLWGYNLNPQLHGQGLEEQIYQFVMGKLSRFDLKKLITSAREDEVEKQNLYANHGFRKTMRYPNSFLEIASFDPSPYKGLREKLESEGIEVATAAELSERDPGFFRKWYDFDWEISKDIPYPDEFTREPFEQFLKWFDGPSYYPEAVFFALEGGELVGTSQLWKNGATEKLLNTGLTGVVRSHRRRRIATMLKVEAIEFARKQGAEAIQTDNEENNPMFQLNLQLGYKPAPAWLDFEKILE
jgi:mycothiol synthase